ncbi:carboxy terminal-processing peptidase [Chitinophaga qingshengii]|uniref:Carboxy terminal-processing peptidase n=1 Tax=Chitinophaga qingshengii TaxID=1569794 RepID=A0ABR7TTQ4_9BACT|nr:carboxy terminal-processing peptidase [Chitinophaga qingshengii]MBC9932831.1 carboxy terminal-processing peptidase [Chitinophaga qingshengii]
MKQVFAKNIPLLGIACALSASYSAGAQAPADSTTWPAYRKEVISAVFNKINKTHFAPRTLDDTYAAAVWKRYIATLDPNRCIFLQEDIQRLSAFQSTIDEEIKSSNTAFFDEAYQLYTQRINELSTLCNQVLARPFDLNAKETVLAARKNAPYPANKTEQAALWRKLLKFYTLRYYMEMQDSSAGTALNPALETKAREKVQKWHADFFKQATRPQAPNDKFFQYIADAALEIDPHTVYTAPKELTLDDVLSRRYYGLGIELGIKEADFFVKRMMPGGSAYRSGQVKENDLILAISDHQGQMKNVTGIPATEVAAMIRGEKDSPVKLQLQQPGDKPRDVVVKREEVIDTENRAKTAVITRDGQRFGYIYLPMFYTDDTPTKVNGACNDVALAVEKLKQEEVDGIIMDLRGNGGGALDEVVRMGYCFVPAGPMTWLRGKEKVDRYNSPATAPLYEGPLTVLVDENSASASEIFAAAMQDRQRGLIIGTSSTFGKGTAQSNANLGKMGDKTKGTTDVSYGSMRLTVEKFYRVTGESTQLKGVRPDIVLQNKMNLESIMEKDYPSALACDTMKLLPFDRQAYNFNYNTVVDNARKRIASDNVLTGIVKNTGRLEQLNAQPAALDLASFRQRYTQVSALEKSVREAKLQGDTTAVQVAAPVDRSIHPSLRQEDRSTSTKDFHQRIAKDIYIAETIKVMEDMISNKISK